MLVYHKYPSRFDRSELAASGNILGVILLAGLAKEQTHQLDVHDKAELVLKSFQSPDQAAELCREKGISAKVLEGWREAFLKGGKRELSNQVKDCTCSDELDEGLYRKIVHSFPGNILVSQPDDGSILFRSPSTQATYGIRNKTSEHWMDPAERQVFIDELEKTGRVDKMLFSGRKHDGTEFPAQLSAQIIEHNGKTITISTSTDLSRFYAMREEIEDANLRFHEALDAVDVGFVLWDSELRLVLENNRMAELLYRDQKRPRKPQAGDTFEQVLREQLADGVYKLSENAKIDKILAAWENLVKSHVKDGDMELADGRILSGSSHPTKNGGYLLTFRDVTDQRRAVHAEREANLLLKLIVDACPTTFLVSRLDDGKIIYYPPESRDRFGDIESTLQFFLEPADRVKYLNALMPSGSLDNYPVRFLRRDGTIMDGLTSARVVTYKGDDVIVSSTRDISDQLAMQRQLDQQKEITHQNEKLSALGELLAGVAHELNNPLSIVVGYSMMLQDKVADPVIDKRIRRIAQAAERCAKIVKMFLAMARQRPMQVENCDINGLIESTLDVAGFGFRKTGGRIKLELESRMPHVAADPDQLAQVITNLVINAEQALKEVDEDPRIKVKTRYCAPNRQVVIKVYDNGRGIPNNIQSRIFEPFFTTKDPGMGTGVGLAFCHRTVTAHNGVLTLNSTRGKGTTFTIRLPVATEAENRDREEIPEPCEVAGKSVLVVDDEEIVTELIRDILEEGGFQVTVENDPQMAIHLAGMHKFDAVLSDMKMPGMSGEQFFQEIAQKYPELSERFAFITGDIMRREVSEFLESGDVPYLEKPVAPDELRALVSMLCEQPRGQP